MEDNGPPPPVEGRASEEEGEEIGDIRESDSVETGWVVVSKGSEGEVNDEIREEEEEEGSKGTGSLYNNMVYSLIDNDCINKGEEDAVTDINDSDVTTNNEEINNVPDSIEEETLGTITGAEPNDHNATGMTDDQVTGSAGMTDNQVTGSTGTTDNQVTGSAGTTDNQVTGSAGTTNDGVTGRRAEEKDTGPRY